MQQWGEGVPEKGTNKEGEEEEPQVSDPETDPDATEKRNKYVGLKFLKNNTFFTTPCKE